MASAARVGQPCGARSRAGPDVSDYDAREFSSGEDFFRRA
jgi:hypothetical protein